MNVSDSQRIATKLEELGYRPASEKEAALVVVNACSVRQKAVDRIWGKIKNWQSQNKQIYVTGCILPADRKKFAERGIKYFNIKALNKLKDILTAHYHTIQYDSGDPKEYFKIRPKATNHIAYVPIMTGCDNFCSYCAVPYTRGREKSRPIKNITSEVIQAIEDGFKEILLLGQNVNSYKYGFAKLLKEIDNLPGNFKFNFVSSNPHDMSEELIKTLAQLKKWPHQLHLPLQSGDDGVLKKMNRRYTSGQYLALISKLRSQISKLILTTDIIVGFPGETKKQFGNTLNLCQKIGLAKAYIAQYSPRPGTTAAKLKDNIPPAEKKGRWLMLEKLINK